MASPVFFIKKKDSKLNTMTVKNTYLLPLILDIINKIADAKAKYFTSWTYAGDINNVQIKEGTNRRWPSNESRTL